MTPLEPWQKDLIVSAVEIAVEKEDAQLIKKRFLELMNEIERIHAEQELQNIKDRCRKIAEECPEARVDYSNRASQ